MPASRIVLLGAIAGATIFLGLPIGRLRKAAPRVKALLNATAGGILLFLLWDMLSHAVDPIESSLVGAVKGRLSWTGPARLGIVFAGGLTAGLLGLVYYERWMKRRRQQASFGPGAVSAAEFAPTKDASMSAPKQLAWFIAIGIGLHNLSEGLAIGQSASKGELSLALALVIGFGLHNATEGFGIVGPLSGTGERPSWLMLGALGLVAGGPTFLGTVVGQTFASQTLFVASLALAAGSILYVLIELLNVGRKLGYKEVLVWGLLLGLLLGFSTDMILVAAGG